MPTQDGPAVRLVGHPESRRGVWRTVGALAPSSVARLRTRASDGSQDFILVFRTPDDVSNFSSALSAVSTDVRLSPATISDTVSARLAVR